MKKTLRTTDLEVRAITVSVNAYDPPSSLIDMEDLSFIKSFTNVIICGNFNAHQKMWDDGTLNTSGQHFINFIDKYDYTILNTTDLTYFFFNRRKIKFALIDMSLIFDISHKCSVEVTNEFLDSDHCIINNKVNLSTNLLNWSSQWALN